VTLEAVRETESRNDFLIENLRTSRAFSVEQGKASTHPVKVYTSNRSKQE
jgi:hypothetical protein